MSHTARLGCEYPSLVTQLLCCSRLAAERTGEQQPKSAGKRKSPSTQVEEGNRPKTRSAAVWGHATSPGGKVTTFVANSGITPDGCSEAGKAVLRGGMKHPGVPGHSETSPAMVFDSPCSSSLSPLQMGK